MKEADSISIIIPIHNEVGNMLKLIPFLKNLKDRNIVEVIVVDGGSTDDSLVVARQLGATVLTCSIKCRAAQLNSGAKIAKGSILYFIHADCLPLESLAEDIIQAVQSGYLAGCFSYKFDSAHPLLKINSWFTRFGGVFSGGGDQTLFIRHSLFNELNGFDEKFVLMEDFELVKRIKKVTKFKLIKKPILVSARKYQHNSWISVQWANLIAMAAFQFGMEPKRIKTLYYNKLNNH